ncbi:serine hydrolase domain-containing protein [Nonomuraea sp. NPDC049607]|uniref:serine hydrolase domain-containing protein n=1 Tax=Nonomuraea sp. NPDC049607 TaxID=3154732 RepID=UPI00341DC694
MSGAGFPQPSRRTTLGLLGAVPLDGFPDEVARHVTVHQLLTHSSGLPDFTVQDPDDVKRVTHSVEEQTRFISTRTRLLKPAYTPGTDKTYSSSGYEILGELVATLSGLPFHEYVRRNRRRPPPGGGGRV